MSRRKGLGVSPITNTIFYGTQDTEKHMWVGEKKDVTDEVIAATYMWFTSKIEDGEKDIDEYYITYPSSNYELVMRRKKSKKKVSD